jgi:histidyl-tRNA synthetase
MAKKAKSARPKARLPKGLRDVGADEFRALEGMVVAIGRVSEKYGFEPLETPAFEYSDALGKFLPDADRPNAGVFSLEDDDGQWMSLRYDLTAPLARYVAANYDALTKPFRRYQTGVVWRNEKPGPGRYREFRQFDADTVGTASVAADAELCMLASEALETIGIDAGNYIIRVNNRKLLDAVLQQAGIDPQDEAEQIKRLTVLRAIDKLARLGPQAVQLLLGPGRKDDSGDFTKGAGLEAKQIDLIMGFVGAGSDGRTKTLAALSPLVEQNETGREGLEELARMDGLLSAAGFDASRVVIDPAIVRGLDYYTGPVFEAELTFDSVGEDGANRQFGSVGGGGRYDGLVERFKGVKVPATGYSFGLSRLYAALNELGRADAGSRLGPVIVLVMDRDRIDAYQRFAMDLRRAGLRAEMYLGESGMRAQMKYADKRGAPCVVIQGEEEHGRGEVTIKDLVEGTRLSSEIADNTEWREGGRAQIAVPEAKLVEAVREVLARQQT